MDVSVGADGDVIVVGGGAAGDVIVGGVAGDVIVVDGDGVDDGVGEVIARPTAVLRGATAPQYSSTAVAAQ